MCFVEYEQINLFHGAQRGLKQLNGENWITICAYGITQMVECSVMCEHSYINSIKS